MSQPPPLPSSSPNHLLHQIPIKIAARKLPVKRKTPDPNPNPNLPVIPKPEISSPPSSSDPDEEDDDLKPPPFKFHRIWSESDELRLLQGLLDSSADGLSFPRDLNLFFDRFSQSMPQPYTKSQLSEKLRRLKKKFRVISARLSRGLDASHLTPHDRSLFHLSKQLWHPAFAASSPFSSSSSSSAKKKSTFSSSRVRVTPSPVAATATTSSPSPTLPPPPPPPYNHDGDDLNNNGEEDFQSGSSSGIGHVAAKTVMDVFDQSLSGVRMVLARHGLLRPNGGDQGKKRDLANKWREQRVAELDVLARRLRLVLEHAVRE
ncbi:hypothetical protein MRB53_008451 [Persea americana]|uniref:Uncharacterized protein n=1 Tax=Persea americana TaxID=3435 RepID=A0ACC2MM64_PERAE|nr:hypothetical protein MRB53_008451 [Persea americana]